MIKPNELRIGNLLKVDGNFWTVDTIISDQELYFKENIEYNHILNAEPIPLDEEWLKKFGSEERGDEVFVNGECFEWFLDGLCYTAGEGIRLSIPVNKVHQLQNLYFSLTGEELTIKE